MLRVLSQVDGSKHSKSTPAFSLMSFIILPIISRYRSKTSLGFLIGKINAKILLVTVNLIALDSSTSYAILKSP